ncbi:MAG TPA: cation transporter [Tepidisphaeraceae bacterium]|jgi:copper chaperone CopZ|nr:cation transporter [Tepidisphaeraceae bacterium]
MEKFNLKIGGMGCGGCIKKVQKALATIPDIQVEDVQVGGARIIGELASTTAVIESLAQAGYTAQVLPEPSR